MNMNKITTTIIIAGALAFTGCKKWLDVKPEGLTTKDEMFKTQKGFRDALTGAYIDMKSGDAYGGAFTWGTVEFLAKNWDIVNTPILEFTGSGKRQLYWCGAKGCARQGLCQRI